MVYRCRRIPSPPKRVSARFPGLPPKACPGTASRQVPPSLVDLGKLMPVRVPGTRVIRSTITTSPGFHRLAGGGQAIVPGRG